MAQARKRKVSRRTAPKKLPKVEVYHDTINPVTKTAALEYVRAHKNIFAKSVRRRVVEEEPYKFVVVREVSEKPWGGEEVWYWGFTREKRGIAKEAPSTKTAIEALRKALL